MNDMSMFLVGGIVRDRLLGVRSKDVDFTVVLGDTSLTADQGFAAMRARLESDGFVTCVETPEFFTIRAKVPAGQLRAFGSNVADFVLARADGPCADGSGKPAVTVGTLADDQDRRDFTVNAMAQVPGSDVVLDRHNGLADLDAKVLRFVGDPMTRIREDALRVMRGLRFSITKGFTLAPATVAAMADPSVPALLAARSEERRADELHKMLAFDTLATLDLLATVPVALRDAMFAGRVRLDCTLRK